MRSLILTPFLLLACLNVSAQGPHIGLKAGLNMSNLYSGEVDDNDARIGFNVGLVARSMVEEPIGLQAELLYSTKGNRTHYEGFLGFVDQDVDFKLNYLELPVLACFRIADNALELQVGGYAGYLMSADVSTEGDLGDGSEEVDVDKLNRMDAGVAGGVAFNAGPAQVGARYSMGLIDLQNSDEAEFLLGDAKNSCLQVYLALGISSAN